MGNEYEHEFAEPYYLTSVCQGLFYFVLGYEKTVINKI